jgi:hypothetical protein
MDRILGLLVVAAADAARLDAQQRVVEPDRGPRELAGFEGRGLDEYRRTPAMSISASDAT